MLANGQPDADAGWGKAKRKRVIPAWVAWEVTKILEDNVTGGTGYPNAYIGRPAAGKTGTTENHADAWFCGYLPNLQATVWMGYPRAQIPMDNVHGIRVAGGTFPAQIWGIFMRTITDGKPVAEWRPPNESPVWEYHRLQYALDPGADAPVWTPPPAPETTETETQETEPPPDETEPPPDDVQEEPPPPDEPSGEPPAPGDQPE